jgi:deoxyribonuclease V
VQSWPRTETEALVVRDALRAQVRPGPGPATPGAVAGLDVAYQGDRLAAAVVVLNPADLTMIKTAVVRGTPAFPYVPGMFAFREIPALLEALERLRVRPDVLVCDGHGRAHPRRFGLASHLVLRTQDRVKPVFVSTGHLMDLDTACSLTLRPAPRHRLPETTRAADRACRDAVS